MRNKRTLILSIITIFIYIFCTSIKNINAAFSQPVISKNAMVVTAHPLATEAGLQMLKKGGNAIDAAVASAFALSVVQPLSAGIGGGGFLLLRINKNGEIKALDFREKAPLKASKNMYLDSSGKVIKNASIEGYLSVAVPGTVAGLYKIHQEYGQLSWSELLKPAINSAGKGFVVSEKLAQDLEKKKTLIVKYPATQKIFTKNGELYQGGDLLKQTDLGQTLKEIAANPQSFYTGKIAQTIVNDMSKNGGLITLEDLKKYQPKYRDPVCGDYKQYQVCSMPPPSSGGVHLIQMLNMIKNDDLTGKGWHDPDTLHLMIETMRTVYADRSEYLGDPDFNHVPVKALINPEYAQYRRAEIDTNKARKSSDVKPATPEIINKFGGNLPENKSDHKNQIKESNDTSHLTVIDQERNTVTLTFTINYALGSGVVVPGTGIVLNDEMDDFSVAPGVPNIFGLIGGEKNAIAPNKIPLSSMTPTIITEKGQLKMALGAPGGSTIITTVWQIILNVLEHQMNASAAISAPRIHHQWIPEQINIEPFGLDVETIRELTKKGHKIEQRSPWGNGNLIVVRKDGKLEGGADPRGDGIAQGY
jgi:gamma-glutamyltranspeptidase / glutathione hydrolase